MIRSVWTDDGLCKTLAEREWKKQGMESESLQRCVCQYSEDRLIVKRVKLIRMQGSWIG